MSGRRARPQRTKPVKAATASPQDPWGNLAAPSTSLLVSALLTAIYVAAVSYVAVHHELWRDEVRALNIAAGAQSIWDLFRLIHNEGHPALWYLVLYAAYGLTHSMLILKPIAVASCAGAAFLLLRRAPFPTWQKALFLAGAYPLYEYSVICRPFGVGMLLIFAVAALFKERFKHPLSLCIALALLANVNAYALVIAGAMLVAVVCEAIVTRSLDTRAALMRFLAGVFVTVAGMAASVVVSLPDATSTVSSLPSRGAGDIVSALTGAVLGVGDLLDPMTAGNAPLAHALFWLAALYLLTRPLLCGIWIASGFGFAAISSLVYPSNPFQRGLLLVLLVALLWIEREHGGPRLPARFNSYRPAVVLGRDVVFVGLMAVQLYFGITMARRDVTAPLSSSKSLGTFLTTTPAYRNAIVISEPAVMVEALPYYASNRIFLPRESKEMIKVDFTTESKRTLSLDELVATADRLKSETGRPVVIVTNHALNPNGPFSIRYPYGLEFTYTLDALERFAARATELAVFDEAISDENYALYELR